MSLGKTIVGMLEETKNLQKRVDEMTKPRPMSEAPRDLTRIIAFERDGTPVVVIGMKKGFAYPGGSWEDYLIEEEFLGWLPCPTYTGEAA